MKRTAIFLLTLLCIGAVVLAAGCIGTTSSQPNPAGTTWTLASFGSGAAAQTPAGIISLTFDNGNISGSGGVNGYGGAYTADPSAGTLTFGSTISTLMAGPENLMQDETRYVTTLPDVTGYKMTADTLTLLDKNGNILLTFTLPLKNTAWSLLTYTAPGAAAQTSALSLMTLNFDKDGKLYGTGGINQFTGTWKLDGAKLTISPVTSTKMAGSPAIMAQEDTYFALLPAVTGFYFSMGTLQLTDGSGHAVLTLKNPLADTTWQLERIDGAVPPSSARTVTLVFDSANSLHGKAPVNTYTGIWKTTGIDTITFGPIATTLMAGTDGTLNDYETRYYSILHNITGYKIADGKLTLTAKDGKTLTYRVNVAEELKGTAWTLSTDSQITLTVGNDGTIQGQAPVNRYTANAVFGTDQTLKISNIATTKMAGTPDQTKKETTYITTLKEVTGYNLVDGQLVLTGPGSAALLTYNQA